jgi:hypothetical protein
MEKPIISPDFTLEDIRKIRDYNAYLRTTMTGDEYIEYTKKEASLARAEMNEYFRLKKKSA